MEHSRSPHQLYRQCDDSSDSDIEDNFNEANTGQDNFNETDSDEERRSPSPYSLRSSVRKREGIHSNDAKRRQKHEAFIQHSGSPRVTRRDIHGHGMQEELDRGDRVDHPGISQTEVYERPLQYYRSSSSSPSLPRKSQPEGLHLTEGYHRRNFGSENEDPRYAYRSQNTAHQHNQNLRQNIFSNYSKIISAVIVTVLSVFFIVNLCLPSPEEPENRYDLGDLTREVRKVVSEFKHLPEEGIFQFSSGIRLVLESDPHRPSVIVLLHEADSLAATCLALEVASLAAKYLHSEEKQPLHLKPEIMRKDPNMSSDHGWILQNYRPLIEKHRSVVLSNLQDLPGSMARAFHPLCDSEDPAIPKSLYIFTLKVAALPREKPLRCAENTLNEIWKKDIDDDIRQALITRMTGDIITLPSNFASPSKCLY